VHWYNVIMQQSKNPTLNQWILTLHEFILTQHPNLVMWEQSGFHANNYGTSLKMGDVVCYILCYEQKANLGFPQGVLLAKDFHELIGTGKTHRHVEISEALFNDIRTLKALIKAAINLKASLNKK
jgi:hypothetical protein